MSHQTGRKRKPTFVLTWQEWVTHARCTNEDPELFFPGQGQTPEPAKQVCRQCPVKPNCLNYALDAPARLDGVWGATTEEERRELRLQRRVS